jgi:anti-sigma factor RsiW
MNGRFLAYHWQERSMTIERTPRTDKELWRRLVSQPSVVPVAVSEMDLAAWLEGRLSEEAAAPVEAAVAANPALRRAAMDLAEILGRPLPAAPERMVVRARALVDFETGRRAPAGGLFARWLRGGGLFGGPAHALQQGLMAAAALVIATGGFVVGGGLGEIMAQQREGYARTETASTFPTTASNEVSEFFAGDGI